MKPKAKIKKVIDVFMTLGLLFLMGYQCWGETAHEWAGAGMLALFIAHHILNWNWYKSLFSGKLTPFRVFQIILDFALLIDMLIQMGSGIVMSRHVFAFLPIDGGMMMARRLHILGAYWGFVLMNAHLGLHWSMFVGMTKKAFKLKESKIAPILASTIGVLIASCGIAAFIRRDLLTYMLLKTEFVFLNFSEPIPLFYLDYLAIMGLFIFLAHYLSKLLKKASKNKENKK